MRKSYKTIFRVSVVVFLALEQRCRKNLYGRVTGKGNMKFSLEDTRAIHLDSMLLLDAPSSISTVEIIQKLGHLQLDTIFVVARSHDLVLHSRSTSYREEEVWELQMQGLFFEEFAHARSLLPPEEFPFYYRKMLQRRAHDPDWFNMVKQPRQLIADTLQLIERSGEITTSDVPVTQEFSSRWSGLKKRVLDYLCLRGYIHVSRRERFSTVYYDLLDRVIDDIPDEDELPDRMEVFWHDITQTLEHQVLVPLHRLLHYTYSQRQFTYGDKLQRPRSLIKRAITSGEIETHQVLDSSSYFSLPGFLETYDVPTVEDPQVFLLSPFDNALWSRESLEAQYHYRYKFEAYTPSKDRLYGFYSLPILYGTDLVGRVDPKLDRKQQIMEFRQWSWEQDFQPSPHFWDQLALTVRRFLDFHNAEEMKLGDLKDDYRRELKQRI